MEVNSQVTNLKKKTASTDEKRGAYAIAGTFDKDDAPKLRAILTLLQKISGDASIEIVDIEEGSIRLILEGSTEGLEKLEALFKSGELTEVEGIPVEDVSFIAGDTSESGGDIRTSGKRRLAFTIAGSVDPADIAKLIEVTQASGSEESRDFEALESTRETSSKDGEARIAEKYRLVEEILTQKAKGRKLSGADLSGVNLIFANLRDANLIGTDLSDVNLIRADLRDADLSGANLNNANLSNANLSGALLSYATLVGANLGGTDLSDASLRDAFLVSANLVSANLRDAFLSGAFLSDASLRDAFLLNANLRDANLRNASLFNANLSGADLSGADLRDSILFNANLRDADLSGAYLRDSNLRDADLIGAKVNGTRFGGNLGISEDMKLDLIRRGAIFEDFPPGDRDRSFAPVPR